LRSGKSPRIPGTLTEHPIDTGTLLHGLLSFAVYIVIFGSVAWARFTSADVTS
jgi:ABC-2 type transport system permease protein